MARGPPRKVTVEAWEGIDVKIHVTVKPKRPHDPATELVLDRDAFNRLRNALQAVAW